MKWDIKRKGYAWSKEISWSRYEMTPEARIEMIGGKLFYTDEERITMIGLLLENVGIDEAIKLADLDLWQEAIDDAKKCIE